VSGQGQREDLTTQLARLEQWADTERPCQPRATLSDIGSGLSTSRKQLRRLLKLVCEERVGEVAITNADRLTVLGMPIWNAYLTGLSSPS
jgi:putative resolvase